ncbi:hypothetical protein DPX16_3816 [Anabarilius grahami]|uniref:THAP-type domain-containing protein n=1 Tax=Anabarilius grahami TaxID=495550 RepID=A0A3N0Y0D1_ANAGA|nr:hypothetical protein DPX16_3816 [Anabarilius grahami]
MADHGNKCYVPDCAGDVSTLHTLPTEQKCQQAWLMFIYNRIPKHFNSKLLVCSAHFSTDSFSNLGQYQAGFAQRLTLKKGAVPTILPHAPIFHQQHTPQELIQIAHSYGKPFLRLFIRDSVLDIRNYISASVQVTVSSQSVAVGNTTTEISWATKHPFTSTPVTASRPAKRPRVELEEDQKMGNVSSDPQDSTYDPARATSTPVHKDAKFIVFEKCLLSLFESCPVCSRACNVRPRRRGTFIAVDQLCPHCEFFRQWRSQPVVGSTPVGNLQLSAAIYFSGASFLKMQKSSEVEGSFHMEKEGLRRSVDLLEESGVKLDCVVTDRHPQIRKFLKHRKINHCCDVWRMVKGYVINLMNTVFEEDVRDLHTADSCASGPVRSG